MTMSMACTTDILVRRKVDGRGCPSYGRFAFAIIMAWGMASPVISAEPAVPETKQPEAATVPTPTETLPPLPT